MTRTLGNSQMRDILHKYMTRTPQNCHGHQKQGKPEKLSSPS